MSSNKEDRSQGIRTPHDERRRAAWPGAAVPEDAQGLRVQSLHGRLYSKIGADAKGDPVLELNVPLRRAGDTPRSYLKYLDNKSLRIADDNWIARSKRKSTAGYNPYDKPPK